MTPSPRITTARFLSYPVDSSKRRASLVVNVIDEFSLEPPTAPLRVLIKENPRQPRTVNPSGYRIFFDVPAGEYTLLVEPDRVAADIYFLRPRPNGEWGFGFERKITLPMANPLSPVETVNLTPKFAYPFPAGATLVRGRVVQGVQADPVLLAVVKTAYEQVDKNDVDSTITVDLETVTDEDGSFVLFFTALLRPKQTIEITAELNSSVSNTVEISEGETKETALVFP